MVKELILQRLNNKTIKDPITNCWLWKGSFDSDGHGQIRIENKLYIVSRLSAHVFYNLDLENKETLALHKLECKKKNCWNPDHLYVGDKSDNNYDSYKSGKRLSTANKTHCINGHEMTEENTYIYNAWKNGPIRKSCRICRIKTSRDRRAKK